MDGRQGTAPTELTASTRTRTSSGITSVTSSMGLRTPVDVSLWVMSTALVSRLALIAWATRSGPIPSPHGTSRGITSTPLLKAISLNLWPKAPHDREITRSPGESRFWHRASNAPVPDPGKRTGGSSTSSRRHRSANSSRYRAENWPLRWDIILVAPSRATWWGTSTGPGVRSILVKLTTS